MPTIEEITLLMEGLGYKDLGLQKNPYMISFIKEESNDRVNIYYGNMTVTIQPTDGGIKVVRDVTLEMLEKIV